MKDNKNIDEDKEVQNGLLAETKTQVLTADRPRTLSFLCSQRWIFSYLLFYFGFVIHVHRVNISLTLPYMVKSVAINNTAGHVTNTTTIALESNVTANQECDGILESDLSNENAEFMWSKLTQSLILAAYFWGYIVTQIPGGWMSGRYGGKRVIAVGTALSSLLTVLSPVLARVSPYALMFVRFVIGLVALMTTTCQQTYLWTKLYCSDYRETAEHVQIILICYPAVFNLVGAWSLPHERSRILGMLLFGNGAGIVVGILTSGILCDKGFDNGWGSVFYIHGICSTFFLVIWVYCVADSPQKHPRITEAEKALFVNHKTDGRRKQAVPWRKLFTTVPVGVVCATHAIQNFTLYLLFLCLPLYLKEVMKFDIQSNGLFFSLPFVTNIVGICGAGVAADWLVSKNVFSTSLIRKLFQCTGLAGMAVMTVIPGYLDCNQYILVIVCLSTSTLFEALGQTAGYNSNIVDIAPRYASVTFGISNTIATIPGMVAPLMVAELTPHGTVSEWRTVFYIAAISSAVGAILFGCFSSSELAPWAVDDPIEMSVTTESGDNPCQELNKEEPDESV